MIVLSALVVYPLKGARGIATDAVELDRFGPRFDRRWMVVEPDGTFLTQREAPRLCLISASPHEGGLRLEGPDRPPCDVPPIEPTSSRRMVRIWDDRVGAFDCGDAAARWCSAWLNRDCRLVHLPGTAARRTDPDYDPAGSSVAFPDGYPMLLIGEASLEDLNRRLALPVPMDRFRPNLVVRGAEPFAEDEWRRFRIGGLRLEAVKPCARCTVPTVDQATSERGKEPLTTLATFRKRGSSVLFGMNVVHRQLGTLRVGDVIKLD
jgi:MOSC domain-containing protein